MPDEIESIVDELFAPKAAQTGGDIESIVDDLFKATPRRRLGEVKPVPPETVNGQTYWKKLRDGTPYSQANPPIIRANRDEIMAHQAKRFVKIGDFEDDFTEGDEALALRKYIQGLTPVQAKQFNEMVAAEPRQPRGTLEQIGTALARGTASAGRMISDSLNTHTPLAPMLLPPGSRPKPEQQAVQDQEMRQYRAAHAAREQADPIAAKDAAWYEKAPTDVLQMAPLLGAAALAPEAAIPLFAADMAPGLQDQIEANGVNPETAKKWAGVASVVTAVIPSKLATRLFGQKALTAVEKAAVEKIAREAVAKTLPQVAMQSAKTYGKNFAHTAAAFAEMEALKYIAQAGAQASDPNAPDFEYIKKAGESAQGLLEQLPAAGVLAAVPTARGTLGAPRERGAALEQTAADAAFHETEALKLVVENRPVAEKLAAAESISRKALNDAVGDTFGQRPKNAEERAKFQAAIKSALEANPADPIVPSDATPVEQVSPVEPEAKPSLRKPPKAVPYVIGARETSTERRAREALYERYNPSEAAPERVIPPEPPPEPVREEKPPTERPVASWVIKNKSTGEIVMETFDRKKVDALNTQKYEAVPIQDYLAELSAKTKVSSGANPGHTAWQDSKPTVPPIRKQKHPQDAVSSAPQGVEQASGPVSQLITGQTLIDEVKSHVDERGNFARGGDYLRAMMGGRTSDEIRALKEWAQKQSRHVERFVGGEAATELRVRERSPTAPPIAQEAPKVKKGTWREWYENEKDPWRQAAGLRALADASKSDTEMSDILDRVESGPWYKANEISNAVVRNKHASASTKKRAAAIYEHADKSGNTKPKKGIQKKAPVEPAPEADPLMDDSLYEAKKPAPEAERMPEGFKAPEPMGAMLLPPVPAGLKKIGRDVKDLLIPDAEMPKLHRMNKPAHQAGVVSASADDASRLMARAESAHTIGDAKIHFEEKLTKRIDKLESDAVKLEANGRDATALRAKMLELKRRSFAHVFGAVRREANQRGLKIQRNAEADQLEKAGGHDAQVASLRKAAADVKSTLGPDQVIRSDAEFMQLVNNAEIKAAARRHNASAGAELERYYKQSTAKDPDFAIPSRDPYLGMHTNQFEHVEPSADAGHGTPQSKSSLLNAGRNKNMMAIRATGQGENYETDYFKQLEHSYRHAYPRVAKMQYLEALQKAGIGIIPKEGEALPDSIHGEKTELVPLYKVLDGKTESGKPKWRDVVMALPRSIAPEVKASLGLADNFSPLPLADFVNRAQMLWSPGDVGYHSGNQLGTTALGLSGLSKAEVLLRSTPGIKQVETIQRLAGPVREIIKDQTAIRREIAAIAKSGDWQFSQHQGLGHVIQFAGAAARIANARAAKSLAKGGLIEGSQHSLHDQQAGPGQYNPKLQGQFTRFLTQSRIGSFAVAAANGTRMGIKAVVGHNGGQATSAANARFLRTASLYRNLAGPVIAAGLVSYSMNGQWLGPGGVGTVAYGGLDENGKQKFVDFMPAWIRRGMRATGLDAALVGAINGHSAERILDNAWRGGVDSVAHPIAGPVGNFAFQMATGRKLDSQLSPAGPAKPAGGSELTNRILNSTGNLNALSEGGIEGVREVKTAKDVWKVPFGAAKSLYKTAAETASGISGLKAANPQKSEAILLARDLFRRQTGVKEYTEQEERTQKARQQEIRDIRAGMDPKEAKAKALSGGDVTLMQAYRSGKLAMQSEDDALFGRLTLDHMTQTLKAATPEEKVNWSDLYDQKVVAKGKALSGVKPLKLSERERWTAQVEGALDELRKAGIDAGTVKALYWRHLRKDMKDAKGRAKNFARFNLALRGL